MAILSITNNDITENIELVCPTNSYSKNLYDPNKETILLLKYEDSYEPIYLYQESNNKITYTITFKSNMIRSVKIVMDMIKNVTNKYCAPLPSIPKLYKFTRNIPAMKSFVALKSRGFDVVNQVLNYQGKIIGLVVKNDKSERPYTVFVPCFPSPVLQDVPMKYMDAIDIWTDYVTTREGLLAVKLDAKIPCKPMIKVLEDNLIVGILTETNQFVQVVPPAENIFEDGLEVVEGSNYLIVDKALTSSKKPDEKRVELVKNITLENQFYSSFRNTVRILINQYNNHETRDSMLHLIDNHRHGYIEKLKRIEKFVRKIARKSIMFQEMDATLLTSFHEITSCVSKPESKKYCIIKEDGEVVLMIPKNNLVSGVDNERVYYGRVADEILRYKRIRTLMFQPKLYLNVSNSEFRVNNNEMIVLQSLLTSDYFEDMIPFESNQYISKINYNIAIPNQSQKYVDTIELKHQYAELDTTEEMDDLAVICVKETRDVLGRNIGYWKNIFPPDTKEFVFNNSNNCSFYPMLTILRERTRNNKLSINDLKAALVQSYNEYMDTHRIKIEHILKKQGKLEIVNRIKKQKVSLETIIMSEDYYLTDLDIWILANKSMLPIILFSNDNFKPSKKPIKWLILHGSRTNEPYYFIRIPKDVEPNRAPIYHLLQPAMALSAIPKLKAMVDNAAEYAENMYPFEQFIENYTM